MTKDNFNIMELKNPDDIERLRNSSEGKVYQIELENIGKEIARLQYHLAIWQYRNIHKQLRFKEYLGFKLTDVEQEQLMTLEEQLSKYEVESDMSKRDNPKNYGMLED